MIYVLAFPDFPPPLSRALGAFRARHEPARAKLVAPHLTLMFGVQSASEAEITRLAQEEAARSAPFPVTFGSHELVHDPVENAHKLFLICDTGAPRLTALHRGLYAGPHRRELRPDLPYRPHMTIGTNADRSRLASADPGALGRFPLAGQVSALSVVRLEAGGLTQLCICPLGKPPAPQSESPAEPAR